MPGAIIDEPIRSRGPPKVVPSKTKRSCRPTNELPQLLIDNARVATKETFDPERHLVFQPPEKITTMKEIGLQGSGISPNAVSDPFPLFSNEAIAQMRAEVFSEEALEHCQYASTFSKNMIRGLGAARAPFIYDAWNHPELLENISKVAGIDLIPAIDFEIANINISVDHQTAVQRTSDGEEVSAFAWHYDSFPFVCIVMLSDCTGMVGGETVLRTESGDLIKTRGPTIGSAVVMQGRYIEHQALKAFGSLERTTMVTAFRPRNPLVKDEIVLTGSRGISNLSELYSQYTDYRLDVLEERIRAKRKDERQRELAKRPFNTQSIRNFLSVQKLFIESMLEELYDLDDD